MISRFLPMVNGDTVLNYYALPLVGVNRKYFGKHFVTTKISKNGDVLFILVSDDVYEDIDFPNKIIHEGNTYLFYKVSLEFLDDMLKIIEGKYSLISGDAKRLIRQNSGLMDRVKKDDGHRYTSKLIYALNRERALIDYMFAALKSGNDIVDEVLYEILQEGELTERVSEDDFF